MSRVILPLSLAIAAPPLGFAEIIKVTLCCLSKRAQTKSQSLSATMNWIARAIEMRVQDIRI